jgi:hypothetical protein
MYKKCFNYALTNLLFGLCSSMWVINVLVTLCSPHPKAPACPSTSKGLWTKERASIPYPFVVFTFKLVVEFTKEFGCRNLNIRLATKARACKGEDQEGSPRITSHVPRSVGECEGMNPHTPKWTPKWAPTLRVRILMDSQIFREQFQGSNHLDWRFSYTIEKLLERKCLKWACMTHLDI